MQHTVGEAIRVVDEIFFGSERHGHGHVHCHSDSQWAFKEKLFAISKERRTEAPDQTLNIDSSAFLTDEEFNQLITEARGILQDR